MTDADGWDRSGAANEAHRPVEIVDGVVGRPAGPADGDGAQPAPTPPGDRAEDRARALGSEGRTERLVCIEGEDGAAGWHHQHTDDRPGFGGEAAALGPRSQRGREPPEDAVWLPAPVPARSDEDLVLCHGDPGPRNRVTRDGEAVGLIAWEHALDWHHFPTVPDRRARIATFLSAYGWIRVHRRELT